MKPVAPIRFLQGMALGIANAIPGVSGGTMAVVLGIYEELIGAISGFFRAGASRVSRLLFLLLLGAGALSGVVVFAIVVEPLLTRYPAHVLLTFMGLILGSLPAVIRMHPVPRWRVSHLAMIALGLALVLLLGNGGADASYRGDSVGAAEPVGYLPLLLGGAAAGAAMIIPGVSGSLVLLLMGLYAPVLADTAAIKDVLPALLSGDSAAMGELAAAGTRLGTVAAGAVAGVLLFSRLIELALRFAPGKTHALIIGLVGGSIIAVYQGFPEGPGGILSGTLLLIAGTVASHWIGLGKRS